MSGLVWIPISRLAQAGPLTVAEWQSMQDQLRTLFASVGDGTGTVTSVAAAVPVAIMSVSGSPITAAGTITISLVVQSKNKVWAGPTTGTDSVPTFRALVIADIPTITVSKGGTGAIAFTSSRVIVSDGSGNLASSGITATTLTYLDATSSIQTQINSKQATITVLPIANGGTAASTAQGARLSLLPSISAKANKILAVNAGATDVEWITSPGGVASINADTTAAQTIVVATSGTDFTITTVGGVTTVALPSASAANRGVVTIAAQTFAGVKTLSSAPIISTLIATRMVYAGASKELVCDAGFTRVAASAYSLIDEIIQNKIAVLTADTTLTIAHEYISSEQLANVVYILPLLNTVPLGKEYFVKDSLGTGAANTISFTSQGGNLLETVANGTKTITTNFGAMGVRSVSAGGGTVVWSLFATMGTVT